MARQELKAESLTASDLLPSVEPQLKASTASQNSITSWGLSQCLSLLGTLHIQTLILLSPVVFGFASPQGHYELQEVNGDSWRVEKGKKSIFLSLKPKDITHKDRCRVPIIS